MNVLRSSFLAGIFLTIGLAARAQVVEIGQTFEGATAPGWVMGGSQTSNTGVVTPFSPTLTDAPGGADAGTGDGWLRMTTTATNEATYAYDATPFSSANATITAQFNYASWGGTGADGITFFLADASVPFSVGAYGGSLGYAQKTVAGGGGANINGMAGGYLGLGIDEFGNYSNPTEGRIGGPGFLPGQIAVRGPGSGLSGYDYLGGTTGSTLSQPIAYPGAGSRPSGSEAETIQIVLTSTNQLTVSIEFGGSGVFTAIFTADLSAYTRPNNLIMGFTSGTGSNTDYHEIQNVQLTSIAANLWTNTGGTSTWTNASNWFGSPSVVPTTGSDVLLNNDYVSTAQSITVAGTQVIRSLQIDAPFSYTLSGGTIEFNNEGVVGPSGIIVTSTNGTAAQTIGSAIQADNAINIQNNTDSTLTLTGGINTSSNVATPVGQAVQFNGTGIVTESGNITGLGSIIQSGTGTTTFSGTNTYTGTTTISAGTLNANGTTSLGTGAGAIVTLDGGTLGSTNASTVSNAINLTASSGLSGITTSGQLTQTGSNTLTMTNATQSGAVSLSSTATSQTLTVETDTGTSTISGIISNGSSSSSGLAKTGAGTLIVSGNNTYTGTTTISAGTLDANNAHALGTGAGATVTLSGGATLGSTNSTTIGNAISLTGNAGLSGITSTGTMTQTGSDTLIMSSATQSGNILLAASGNSTVQNMTTEVDSGSSTISGIISNGGSGANGIDKTGVGTLVLSGANTYTGTTQVDNGTLSLTNNNVISTSSNVVLNGGVLALNNTSQKVGNLSFANATLDFGTSPTIANDFVVGSLASGTGVLTVANYKTTDMLGSVSNSTTTASLASQVYFAGYGSGTLATSTSTFGSEGNAYLISPNTTFLTWKGTGTSAASTHWSTGSNWSGGTAPSTTAGSTQKLDFTGSNTLATMNSNYSVNAIKFDSTTSAFTITQAATGANAITMSGNVPSIIDDATSGTQTIGGGTVAFGTVAVNGVIDVTSGQTLDLNSAITGGTAVSITKTGVGTAVLAGANTGYTGSIDVAEGTLSVTNANGLGASSGAGTTSVEDGASLAFNITGTPTVTNSLVLGGTGASGVGALTAASSMTLSGTIGLTDNTSIASLTSGQTLTLSGGISPSPAGGNPNLTIMGPGNTTISGAITTGTGGLTVTSTGTTTLTGANTFTGTTTDSAGTLNLSGTGTTVAGNLVINGGAVNETVSNNIATGSTVTVNSGSYNLGANSNTIAGLAGSGGSVNFGTSASSLTVNDTSTTTYSGVITGAGSLVKTGSGTLDLTASNGSYTGTTTVSGGTLAVSGVPTPLGTGGITVSSTGNLQISNGVTLANNLSLSSSSSSGAIESTSGNNTLSGTVTLTGSSRLDTDAGLLTVSGAVGLAGNSLSVGGASNTTITSAITGTSGSSIVKDGNGTLLLTTASPSFVGSITANAGSIEMGATGILNSVSNITLNTSAVLNLNDFNQTVANITATGAINFGSTGNAKLTLLGGTSSLAGTFSGYGTIVVGAGETLTLNNQFNSSNINIDMEGGTLNLNGYNDTFGSLTVGATSTIDFGAGTLNSDLNVSSVTVGVGDKLNVSNWTNGSDYFYSTTSVGGVGSSPADQIVFDGQTGTITTHWNATPDGPDDANQITPAPEPSTYGALFVGLSLAGILIVRRRRTVASAV